MGTKKGWRLDYFGVCDVQEVEDEKLTPLLAILSIQLKQQEEGVAVEMPEPSRD